MALRPEPRSRGGPATRDRLTEAERLVDVLQEAPQQIGLLEEEVDKLRAPPGNDGASQRPPEDDTRVAEVEKGIARIKAQLVYLKGFGKGILVTLTIVLALLGLAPALVQPTRPVPQDPHATAVIAVPEPVEAAPRCDAPPME